MAYINAHYLQLPGDYLFSEVARRVAAHTAAHPDRKLIRLGIGDVTRPLAPAIIEALNKAVAEQGVAGAFRGYGPERGYPFLIRAIIRSEYAELGIAEDEVFISDGAKCDLGNFPELFAAGSTAAITDPVYPAYADANTMIGRDIIHLPCTAENGYLPQLPATRPDIIYLCYPNNPTGTVLTRQQLHAWVEYARAHDCVIFFDAAYEAFIREPDIPHSIYEIPAAREVAVEFRSYSKSAGFTGLRCGYVVAPKSVGALAPDGARISLNALWNRRQSTKYNGCPYIVQRAAEAAHSPEAKAQLWPIIDGYLDNARRIKEAFAHMGLSAVGGINAPYVWVRLPQGVDSWDFFDALLVRAGIVSTPGAGFGAQGQGCLRLTGFGDSADTAEAIERLRNFVL
ncbi:MAG: LL-diaminopimelate aminotransferase [Deltaproteobacteria bacterium]|jgi:LL-diaminopimelate aminotransferase|nr:LL-diaminopimelate aminotransferase [Deltaproteobacteria bacterium]